MNNQNIQPEKITKPIQLLGAWLVGLFSINSTFLVAAVNLSDLNWASEALVIAAILNVPIFLIAVFTLQTKFRPELQEDSYYAEYISQKTNEFVKVPVSTQNVQELLVKIEHLEEKLASSLVGNEHVKSQEISDLLFGVNSHLDDREAIKGTLSTHDIIRITGFGPEDKQPTQRVMSISQYLSSEKIKQLVSLARELKMDGYRLFDNRMEETEEDVLIGSYGKPQFEILASNT
ncbi:TPA: hypothetical protein N2685_004644 [Vibrio parahaemolyticus]|uniref:hypothetical protein n=1 Tax=Vibrio TaxID=662 RepID=UPI00235F4A1E|nr:hypothetical protein [Vibrio parahaemolyticus]ELF6478282.1 hypothetical protein [Vibrio cholerae]HCE2380175.1 hypothetical protein [Vibrio parahaemolyticus]HCG6123151.1 hypothetical protein [Vibrio parahaemolyticus]HCG6989574.1 hypothetical protein [Vibrio parahaemolyticus]HCG8728761.1 hypothetical protein [Vibrio parahaemolyticus]